MFKDVRIPFILVRPTEEKIINFLKEKALIDSVIFKILPQGKEYSIEDIRNLKNNVFYNYQKKVVFLIKNFDNSSIEAQNSFLKLLEEPPKNIFFILTVKNLNKLLPTVISRTRVFYFKDSFTINNLIINIEDWPTFSTKESALEYLKQLLIYYYQKLKKNSFYQKEIILIIKEILKITKLIENNNLNYQLAVDHLLIFIKKKIKV